MLNIASATTTDCLVQPSLFPPGSRNQHSPSPPMYNSVPSLSNIQGSVIPYEKLVEGSSVHEKHVDAASTGKDAAVCVVNIDAESSKKVGDVSQHSGRNTSACTCHSTPLMLVTREGNTCVRIEERATVKLIFILVLLSTAARAILQTNLPAPVICHLLVAIVSAFSYLLLIAVQSHKKHVWVSHAIDVCFGITTFEMALAVMLRVWGLSRSSSIGS